MPRAKKEPLVVRKEPYSIETEQALLGELMIDNNVASDLIPKMKEEDFFDAKHRIIFKALADLNRESKPIDFYVVQDKLTLMGKLDDVGSIEYLTYLCNSVVSSIGAEEHLRIIQRDSVLRKLIAAGNAILDIAYTSSDQEKALNLAESQITKIEDDLDIKELTHASTLLAQAQFEIQQTQQGKNQSRYVYTNRDLLDMKLKGLKPQEIIIIAARPSVGKTAFALNIATDAVLRQKKRVAFFSLEMSSLNLCKRLIAGVSGVSLEDINSRGKLSPLESQRVMEAYTQLSEAELYIDDYAMNTPNIIFSKCKKLQREKGQLDLVIIDYLQLMMNDIVKGQNISSRQEIVASLSRNLKLFAKELNVPIVVLSQLRRIRAKDDGKGAKVEPKPDLEDLRESGQIEQDADVVMFLHRPSSTPRNEEGGLVELLIKKNRNGPQGDINLAWYPSITTFRQHDNQDLGDEANFTTTPAPQVQVVTTATSSNVEDEFEDTEENEDVFEGASTEDTGLQHIENDDLDY